MQWLGGLESEAQAGFEIKTREQPGNDYDATRQTSQTHKCLKCQTSHEQQWLKPRSSEP